MQSKLASQIISQPISHHMSQLYIRTHMEGAEPYKTDEKKLGLHQINPQYVHNQFTMLVMKWNAIENDYMVQEDINLQQIDWQ